MTYLHPFPARMAPELAAAAIDHLEGPRQRVLDPMCGSGTTLLAARRAGHHAIGLDLDPHAVMLSKGLLTSYESNLLRDASEEVLQLARSIKGRITQGTAYPESSDFATREFLRYWFDPATRIQLTALIRVIDEQPRDELWRLLRIAFSRMIIVKENGVSLAMDVAHSRPHRTYDKSPTHPFDLWPVSIATVARAIEVSRVPDDHPLASVMLGDARATGLPDSSIDAIVTSPPYLNGIDYIRASKFALVWFGHNVGELRELRASLVGAERGLAASELSGLVAEFDDAHWYRELPSRQRGLVHRYLADMRSVLAESARVLKLGATAVLVVGDSRHRGVTIPNSEILQRLASLAGFKIIKKVARPLPTKHRYLPPPQSTATSDLDRRLSSEWVLTFKKTSGCSPSRR
ncbi:MAG: DNA methyltransferase [Acidimicrobiia bacterium]